jgi:hypothetical protein
MAISKANAEAAVGALSKLHGSALATLMASNKHLFEKHLAKAKAFEAAKKAHQAQGYFEKVVNYVVNNSEDVKKQPTALQQRLFKKMGITALSGKNARKVVGTWKLTNEAGEGDLGALLGSAFAADQFWLYASGQEPETRFLYVTAMPAGFVGRSVDEHGAKDKNVTWVVIVVNGTSTTNPQLVTVYPAADAYVDNLTDLV